METQKKPSISDVLLYGAFMLIMVALIVVVARQYMEYAAFASPSVKQNPCQIFEHFISL